MSLSGISADVAAAAQGNEPYEVPDNARPVKNRPNKKVWTEAGRVRLLKKYNRDDKPYTCYQISVDIGAEGSGRNTGRRFTRTLSFNNERAKQGRPAEGVKDGQWMMCVITTRLLVQLLKAFNLPTKDDEGNVPSESLDALFSEGGTSSDFMGEYVGFEMSQEEKDILDENGTLLRKEYNSDFESFFKYGG